jgi:hypothetical protein
VKQVLCLFGTIENLVGLKKNGSGFREMLMGCHLMHPCDNVVSFLCFLVFAAMYSVL